MIRRRKNTLLIGYVGKANLGDDMMVEAVAAHIPRGDYEIIDGRISILRLLCKLVSTHRIVVCGGGVIGPRTGSYQRVLVFAKLLGVRRIFSSIEVSGWPSGKRGRVQKWIMQGADISCRTFESSAIVLQAMATALITNVMDLFYLHPQFSTRPKAGAIVRFGRFVVTAGHDRQAPATRIVVLPRSFPSDAEYSNAHNLERMMQVVGGLSSRLGEVPVLVSASANVDDVAEYVEALRNVGYRVHLAEKDEDIKLSQSDYVVSNRLHIGKACAFYGIPNTLVSYHRKTELPEIFGETGQILQLSGKLIELHEVSMSAKKFEYAREMSVKVLGQSLEK